MASPLTMARNNYHTNPKNSVVYTPPSVAQFLFDILHKAERFAGTEFAHLIICDPAIGSGNLTDPWYHAGCRVYGCDISSATDRCHQFYQGRFEDRLELPRPNLVLCNPPFNGASGKQLYPEVFLWHVFELWGPRTPVVLFVPMGFRLNQRRKSKRFRWIRDCGARITSIVSLPLDTFPDVEFHAEILIFNINGLQPHYFLPERAL